MIITSFTGSLLYSFEFGMITISPFRIFFLLVCFIFIINYFMQKQNKRGNKYYNGINKYLKFLLFWLVYAFLSISWAVEKNYALRHFTLLFMGISIVFFIVYNIKDLKNLMILYWLFICVFIAFIPLGLWEVITGNHLDTAALSQRIFYVPISAPAATFTNQNDYATYIVLYSPFIFVWCKYYTSIYSRILSSSTIIAGLYLLIMTTSRSCYIAFGIGFIFWIIFCFRFSGVIKTLIILVAFYFIVFNKLEIISEILTNQILSLTFIDTSNEIRLNLIKNAFYFLLNSFGAGVGAGNAEYYMQYHSIYYVAWITNVHNWWIEILVNYGVLVFSGYVILYVKILLELLICYKKLEKRNEIIICEALLVGWISFFIASMASSSIMAFSQQWLYLGFILSFLNYIRFSNCNYREATCTF